VPAVPAFNIHLHQAPTQVLLEQEAPPPAPIQVTAQVTVPRDAIRVDVHTPPSPAVPMPRAIEKKGKFVRSAEGKIIGFEAEETPKAE
jgi:hypothetical protein